MRQERRDMVWCNPGGLEIGIVIQSHVMGIGLKTRKTLHLSTEKATHEDVSLWKDVLDKEVVVSRKIHAMKLNPWRNVRFCVVLMKDENVRCRKLLACIPKRRGKKVALIGSSKLSSHTTVAWTRQIDDTPRHL
jgi:hypothetical protein